MTTLNTCQICGKKINKYQGRFCSACSTKYHNAKLKKWAIDYKGGKCELCGYHKSISALEFHHVDPSQKEFEISKAAGINLKLVKLELDKCMLLCANCHREIHCSDYDSIISLYERAKESINHNNLIIQSHKNHTTKEQRIEIIKNSGIDFSKFGWSKQLEIILGIKSAPIVRWMKKNMPDFYQTYCYREKHDNEIDIKFVIEQYNTGQTIANIADKIGVDISRINAILDKANIKKIDPHKKEIYMIDKLTNSIIQKFSSIKEAGIYCKNNSKHKTNNPSLRIITKRISECANGYRLSAYGYKWQFPTNI